MPHVPWLRRSPLRLLLAATLELLLIQNCCSASVLSASSHDYRYTLQFESDTSRLIYLAEFALGTRGSFDMALDVVLTVDTPKAVAGRTMLYLVVCDSAALEYIQSLASAAPMTDATQQYPAYCAMTNSTISDYCLSYPLADTSHNDNDSVYRTQQTLAVDMHETTVSSDNDGMLYFFLDACETVGGDHGVLRSCLKQPDNKADDANAACFNCPKHGPSAASTCRVSPPIKPHISVSAAMNLCNEHGECLGATERSLSTAFAVSAVLWTAASVAWLLHIRAFQDAAVALQRRMQLVPITQAVSATMTSITLFTSSHSTGTVRNCMVYAMVVTQIYALAVTAEGIVLIAKGWQITRPALSHRARSWIRFVTLLYAALYALLRNGVATTTIVGLVWGASYATIVFLVWYNAAYNVNMLAYQVALVRQLHTVDHTRTPVFTKYKLFRRFRGILGLYMLLACVSGVIALVSDATSRSWRSVIADEALNYLLCVTLGVTFRCRRFRNLLHTTAPDELSVPHATRGSATSVVPALISHEAEAEAECETQQKPKPTRVVVLNPDQMQALGTTYQVRHDMPSNTLITSTSAGTTKVAAACVPGGE